MDFLTISITVVVVAVVVAVVVVVVVAVVKGSTYINDTAAQQLSGNSEGYCGRSLTGRLLNINNFKIISIRD